MSLHAMLPVRYEDSENVLLLLSFVCFDDG